MDFLENLNAIPNKWDWKVTACFYTAVHLINAHIAQQANMHFRSHKKVEQVINPYSAVVATRLQEDIFVSYQMLSNLSRRSRYICSVDGPESEPAQLTRDKHLKKALHHLDVLLQWFVATYPGQVFAPKTVRCPELTKDMTYFKVPRVAVAS
ncbi:MAG: hypothetical protein ACRYFX_19865 [Janthinobacterium lividum]